MKLTFSANSPTSLFIRIAVFVVVVAATVSAAMYYQAKHPKAGPQPTQDAPNNTLPGWQAVPAEDSSGREQVTNEAQGFSAEAPEGWHVVVPDSSKALITKEGFETCKITLSLGSNDGYLSAAGFVDQLNPPGPKPSEKSHYTGVVDINGWPAAQVTILDLFEGEQKEVNIPKGNILYIARMEVKGVFTAQGNIDPNPRQGECENAFADVLKSLVITS